MITQEFLKSILHYDPATGEFTRLTSRGNRKVGTKAANYNFQHRNGTPSCVKIKIGDKGRRVHQLAWLYMTGEWPVYEIDHIDGNPFNNKWDNLRLDIEGLLGLSSNVNGMHRYRIKVRIFMLVSLMM